MTVTAYLAGPDVFLPNAVEHAARKVEICRRFGLQGLPPLNQDIETAAKALDVWQSIYEKDIAMMERCDIIIANLTPFGGASADAGLRGPRTCPGPLCLRLLPLSQRTRTPRKCRPGGPVCRV